MKALRISSSAVPLISCTLRGFVPLPPDAPICGFSIRWQFQDILDIYVCSENFPRKEKIQSFLNCSTVFGVESKFHKPKVSHLTEMEGIIGQMMSSHLAAMRVLPDSARSLKIEMNIWDLTSVSKKSMQQKIAIVSNEDQAPFYPLVFLRCLRISKRCEAVGIDTPGKRIIYSTQSDPKKHRLKVPFSGGRISEILAKKRWHWTFHGKVKAAVSFIHR